MQLQRRQQRRTHRKSFIEGSRFRSRESITATACVCVCACVCVLSKFALEMSVVCAPAHRTSKFLLISVAINRTLPDSIIYTNMSALTDCLLMKAILCFAYRLLHTHPSLTCSINCTQETPRIRRTISFSLTLLRSFSLTHSQNYIYSASFFLYLSFAFALSLSLSALLCCRALL